MTSLSPIEQQIDDRKRQQEAERLKAEADKQLAQEDFKILDKLLTMPEFHWYLDKVLTPLVTDELVKALDISKDKDARDHAAHRHDFGQEILRAAEQKRIFSAKIGEIQT
jgi:hypothetical protein